jgi:hypothetical protein
MGSIMNQLCLDPFHSLSPVRRDVRRERGAEEDFDPSIAQPSNRTPHGSFLTDAEGSATVSHNAVRAPRMDQDKDSDTTRSRLPLGLKAVRVLTTQCDSLSAVVP